MKILYLKLKNSAGIYAGTSRREIEIDFSKGKNDIVMLFGGNGSGKTTILSSLHPFNSSTNDDRDSFFIKGEPGEKHIHYKHKDVVYLIRHYVNKKGQTKSYLARITYKEYISLVRKKASKTEIANFDEAEELNENGGVKTFVELVKEHLGVDEDFFKISRIGSNVTNFIDLSTANRKKYISTFLPNIDEYLERYNIVNDKYRAMGKEIKYLSDQIMKLQNQEELEEEKTRLEKQLKSLKRQLEQASNGITAAKTTVQNLDPDGVLKQSSYQNPYLAEVEKLQSEVERREELSSQYSMEDVEAGLQQALNNKLSLFNKVESTKQQVDALKERQNEISVKIKEKDKQLRGISATDIETINNTQKELQRSQKKFQTWLDSVDLSAYGDLEGLDVGNFVQACRQLYREFSSIISMLSFPDDRNLLTLTFVERQYTLPNARDEIRNFEADLKKLTKEYKEVEKEITTQMMRAKIAKELEKRPAECSVDSCPFIANALAAKDADDKLAKALKRREELDDLIQHDEDEIETLESFLDAFKDLMELYDQNEIGTALSAFKLADITTLDSFMFWALQQSPTDVKRVLFDDIDNLSQVQGVKQELANIKVTMEANDKILQSAEDVKKLRSDLEAEREALKEDLDKNADQRATLTQQLQEYTQGANFASETAEKLKQIKQALSELEALRTELRTKKEISDKTDEILDKIEEQGVLLSSARETKRQVEADLQEIEDSLDKVKYNISRLQEYQDRKKVLDSDYEKTGWIKEALNPTKGIPVHFIDNYLSKTKLIANNLLDLSQHGKFAIDFSVTDKEFFIKVFKNNGDILTDITQASQGEIALTSLSLSLALIEQSMTQYNIFLLDELDGALDAQNRRSFIDMVDHQMKAINSEQVFIISHNNEFENLPVDMILLNDHNVDTSPASMENRTILFQT